MGLSQLMPAMARQLGVPSPCAMTEKPERRGAYVGNERMNMRNLIEAAVGPFGPTTASIVRYPSSSSTLLSGACLLVSFWAPW
ncbi:hypothetical protein [Novosphingobium sp. 9U]|uniref:hypothetical protein n=1 Tax=Novosphingobium sp. 9U TaxID=2653158 RepID=UPI00352D8062